MIAAPLALLAATGIAAAQDAGDSMDSMSMATASGMFEGRSNHVSSGGVDIVVDNDRAFVVLGEDFMLDGGPDPRVAFGNDGTYADGTILGALVSLSGKQVYAVPPTMNVEDYSDVVIWCEVAQVPLAVAMLSQ
ncbi:MAG: DM13 domain-containing protein [Silicimonas sp.]|nr:DM13 domain-containing protein [Silicimonas sp.]